MKKIVVIMIVFLALVGGVCAAAEDLISTDETLSAETAPVALHNGLVWGMTPEEVIAHQGYVPYEKDGESIFSDGGTVTHLRFENVEAYGFNSTMLCYFVDGKLGMIRLQLREWDNRLDNAYNNQIKEDVYSVASLLYPVYGSTYDDGFSFIMDYRPVLADLNRKNSANNQTYHHWIPQEDTHIVILGLYAGHLEVIYIDDAIDWPLEMRKTVE